MNKLHEAHNDQVSSWSYISEENKIVINSNTIAGIEKLTDENLKELKAAFYKAYPETLFPKDFYVFNASKS